MSNTIGDLQVADIACTVLQHTGLVSKFCTFLEDQESLTTFQNSFPIRNKLLVEVFGEYFVSELEFKLALLQFLDNVDICQRRMIKVTSGLFDYAVVQSNGPGIAQLVHEICNLVWRVELNGNPLQLEWCIQVTSCVQYLNFCKNLDLVLEESISPSRSFKFAGIESALHKCQILICAQKEGAKLNELFVIWMNLELCRCQFHPKPVPTGYQIGVGNYGVVHKMQLADKSYIVSKTFETTLFPHSIAAELYYSKTCWTMFCDRVVGSDYFDYVEYMFAYEECNTIRMAMKFYEHGDLLKYKENVNSKKEEKIGILFIAGMTLSSLTLNGFTHRDFKPSNILIGDKKVVLSDLMTLTNATRSIRSVKGTLIYMMPELHAILQTEGKPSVELLIANDAFAFAKTIKEVLTAAELQSYPLLHKCIEMVLADAIKFTPLVIVDCMWLAHLEHDVKDYNAWWSLPLQKHSPESSSIRNLAYVYLACIKPEIMKSENECVVTKVQMNSKLQWPFNIVFVEALRLWKGLQLLSIECTNFDQLYKLHEVFNSLKEQLKEVRLEGNIGKNCFSEVCVAISKCQLLKYLKIKCTEMIYNTQYFQILINAAPSSLQELSINYDLSEDEKQALWKRIPKCTITKC